ncbi:precorrin-8X methylmutase [Alkalinema pantanalense CENA528]|uniref:precorrin-8X methylmutase n=1 Tax=Alkalinema pantanalense TaxID=1620705 RepID=UPI003D6EBF69
MPLPMHPIMAQSFAVIDQEIGDHRFSSSEYAIMRRVIHSTADFEFKELLQFSPGSIAKAISALQQRVPIVVDVGMVRQGIVNLVQQTFQNPVIVAVEQATEAEPGRTRTETGLLQCLAQYPQAIYVIGNAPTALLALCHWAGERSLSSPAFPGPALVIGAPVGFIAVKESKQALAESNLPQIRITDRKGGSPAAAAILNALLVLAWDDWEQQPLRSHPVADLATRQSLTTGRD